MNTNVFRSAFMDEMSKLSTQIFRGSPGPKKRDPFTEWKINRPVDSRTKSPEAFRRTLERTQTRLARGADA